jgi:hypothetical protein
MCAATSIGAWIAAWSRLEPPLRRGHRVRVAEERIGVHAGRGGERVAADLDPLEALVESGAIRRRARGGRAHARRPCRNARASLAIRRKWSAA